MDIKKLVVIILIFSKNQNIVAQTAFDSIALNSKNHLTNLVKIVLSNDCGLQYEHCLNKSSTIIFFGGISLGRQSNNYTDKSQPIITSPDMFIEYRNYYDFKNRIKKNKLTHHNSGEFLFGRIESVFGVKGQNAFSLLCCQGMGIQRSDKKIFSFGLHLGIIEHLFFDKPVVGGYNTIKLEPLVSANISIALEKIKNTKKADCSFNISASIYKTREIVFL